MRRALGRARARAAGVAAGIADWRDDLDWWSLAHTLITFGLWASLTMAGVRTLAYVQWVPGTPWWVLAVGVTLIWLMLLAFVVVASWTGQVLLEGAATVGHAADSAWRTARWVWLAKVRRGPAVDPPTPPALPAVTPPPAPLSPLDRAVDAELARLTEQRTHQTRSHASNSWWTVG